MSRTTRMMAFIATGSGGGVPSALPTISASDDQVDPASASANLTFETNGVINASGTGPNSTGNWFSPTTSGIGNSYWVKVVVSSGTISGMTSGTWYALSSSRTMTKVRAIPGVASASGTYFISTAGSDGTIIGDADGGAWSLTATVEA